MLDLSWAKTRATSLTLCTKQPLLVMQNPNQASRGLGLTADHTLGRARRRLIPVAEGQPGQQKLWNHDSTDHVQSLWSLLQKTTPSGWRLLSCVLDSVPCLPSSCASSSPPHQGKSHCGPGMQVPSPPGALPPAPSPAHLHDLSPRASWAPPAVLAEAHM